MITLESLKENREQIIDLITVKAGSERVKELMGIMVKSIGANVYEGMSVMKFAAAVIEDNPAKLVITDSTEYYRLETLKQLPSSMR